MIGTWRVVGGTKREGTLARRFLFEVERTGTTTIDREH
jgi:hypothetical protein